MPSPFVHINCASTLDGRISRPDGSRLRISCRDDMVRVHRLRADLGSIMVGAGTILMDDPKLTVKDEYTSPVPLTKIIVDGKGRIPTSSRFLMTEGHSIIITSGDVSAGWLDDMSRTIEEEDLDTEIIIMDGDGYSIPMDAILKTLSEIGIDRILVEGGSTVIGEIVKCGIFDLFTIYYGPTLLGGKGPGIFDSDMECGPFGLMIKDIERIGEGFLVHLSQL